MRFRFAHSVVFASFIVALAGCDSLDITPPVDSNDSNAEAHRQEVLGKVTGDSGITLFGGTSRDTGSSSGGIAVNSYLWRASLDTIAFMPLASADPFGGVIITDWYTPPGTPNERFKATVYVLDRQLRADGIRVAVFHQLRDGNGGWNEAPVDAKTAGDLENAILTRARQLRLDSTSTASK